MLAAHRPEGGEAAVIGVRLLDRFAIVDASRRGERRRSEDSKECRNRQGQAARSFAKKPSSGRFTALDGFMSLETTVPHPLSAAPHFFCASATIFWATASISASVRVFSRGCRVTARPIDFLPSGTPLPS